MAGENFNELVAFLTVAQERSFTRAAARLGVTQSTLSHTVRNLEERLGLRLLHRTTRSVSPTDAGERLLLTIGPRFEEIETELARLSELKAKPAGTVRITAADFVAQDILWPRLVPLLRKYPDINIEIGVDYALTDIVAERYDAGVRIGDQVAKGMIAVRIAPDFRMAIVASPAYLKERVAPKRPSELAGHSCVNQRLPTYGGLYAWELERSGRTERVRVSGQLIFNNVGLILQAATDGLGLAFVPESVASVPLAKGRLVPVLEDWWPTWPGFHLYYSSRRQGSPALSLVVEALRYRAGA